MPNEIEIKVPLTPDQCIERISSSTIPISKIVDMQSPFKSYATYLKDTILRKERYISKIDLKEFSIIPIVPWPRNSRLFMSNVGSLRGSVVPTKFGSQIDAKFKLFAGFVIPCAIINLGLVLFSCGLFALLLIGGSEMDTTTLTGTTIGACLLLCFPVIFAAFTALARWHQRRSASRFLDQLFADIAK